MSTLYYRMFFFFTVLLLPAGLSPAAGFSGGNMAETAVETTSDFPHVSEADLDSIFSFFDRPDTPGCAVGVVSDGRLICARGYGIANLDYGIPIRPVSRFMVASVSKQFAAASLLMMEQQGLLDLDEDIRGHIPELQVFNTPITAGQLMHHTSGLRDIYHLLTLADIGLDNTTTTEDVLQMISRQKKLNFPSGSEHLYSNTGYFLISVLTKNITGMSLRDYTQKHFLDPSGMNNTHWHDDTGMIVPDRVISYRPMPFGPGRFYRDNMDRVGARGLFTTIRDFAKWEANFVENQTNLDHFRDKMMRAGSTDRGNRLNYATGLRISRYKTLQTMGHGGSYMGFRTEYMRFPQLDFAVILFCNKSNINPSPLVRQVADLYLRNIFDEQFRPYSGSYYNPYLQTGFEIVSEDGDLYMKREGEDPRRLVWWQNDRFRAGEWEITFLRSTGNRIDRFTIQTPRTGNISFHRQ